MGRSKQLGTFLMIAATVQALIMLIGTMRRSYLAIALPVLAAVGLVSALAFWVGWTLANTEPDLAELEERESVPAVA
jgi:uncharacterized membrane protein YesL